MHKGGVCLAFGDSISWTIPGDVNAKGENLYCNIIKDNIGKDYGLIRLINKGYGGSRSGDILSRLKFLALGIPYDLVTIQCGMNDCSPTVTDINIFKENMKTVINTLKQYRPNCEIIYCKIPYTSDVDRLLTWADYNAMIDTIVSETGILKADFDLAWDASGVATYVGVDGIHPISAGHAKLANDYLYPVVQETNFVKRLIKTDY